MDIVDLQPLGYHNSGITKAGRLSFAGHYEGRKVKIYSCSSRRQIELRMMIGSCLPLSLSFPRVLATNNELVVEEWIDGRKPTASDFHDLYQRIERFLNDVHRDEKLVEVASRYDKSFCYIDFLLSRVRRWQHLNTVATLAARAEGLLGASATSIPYRISHADLSLKNIVIDQTGLPFVIDNELLGSGQGWILDYRNSPLSATDQYKTQALSHVPEDLIDTIWTVRTVSTALEAGNFAILGDL